MFIIIIKLTHAFKHCEYPVDICVCVGLHSLGFDPEESPVTDEDERPLSQGELRKRIWKGVSAGPALKFNLKSSFSS